MKTQPELGTQDSFLEKLASVCNILTACAFSVVAKSTFRMLQSHGFHGWSKGQENRVDFGALNVPCFGVDPLDSTDLYVCIVFVWLDKDSLELHVAVDFATPSCYNLSGTGLITDAFFPTDFFTPDVLIQATNDGVKFLKGIFGRVS